MNAPLNQGDLHDVLTRATDALERPHLAAQALADARTARARRRGATAAGAVVAAVLAVVALTQMVSTPPSDRRPSVPVIPPPTTAAELDATAPPVPDDAAQPMWDPATVGDLPWAEDSVLPRDLAPSGERSEVDSLLVALLFEDVLYGVGPGQASTAFSLPEAPISGSNSALSADGTRLAFTGKTAIWWREVQAGGSWVRVDYPVKFARSGEWGVTLTFGDNDQVLLQELRRGFTINLLDGSSEPFPKNLQHFAPVTAADGRVVATTFTESTRSRTLGEYDGAETIRSFNSTILESLSGLSVSDTAIAAVRGVGGWSPPRQPAEFNGLIALERATLRTRAYLPIHDPDWGYTDGGQMRTVAWLDSDTVLVEVEDVSVSSRYLFSWNVETGDLRRVAVLPHEAPLSAAAGAFS